jgi:hypothetical protein
MSGRSVQFTLRLSPEEYDELGRAADLANQHAQCMGLPHEVTRGSLVRLWIQEKLALLPAPETEPTIVVKDGSKLKKARAILRGSR